MISESLKPHHGVFLGSNRLAGFNCLSMIDETTVSALENGPEVAMRGVVSRSRVSREVAGNERSISNLLKIVAKTAPGGAVKAGLVFAHWRRQMVSGARVGAGSVTTKLGGGARPGRYSERKPSR
jgi:hypothetical protein